MSSWVFSVNSEMNFSIEFFDKDQNWCWWKFCLQHPDSCSLLFLTSIENIKIYLLYYYDQKYDRINSDKVAWSRRKTTKKYTEQTEKHEIKLNEVYTTSFWTVKTLRKIFYQLKFTPISRAFDKCRRVQKSSMLSYLIGSWHMKKQILST